LLREHSSPVLLGSIKTVEPTLRSTFGTIG
jgi:hypothetical protein